MGDPRARTTSSVRRGRTTCTSHLHQQLARSGSYAASWQVYIVFAVDETDYANGSTLVEELLGNSPNALRFIATYIERRRDLAAGLAKQGAEYGSGNSAAQPYSGQSGSSPESPNVRKMDLAAPNMGQRQQNGGGSQDHPLPLYAPPSGPPPASSRPVSTRQYIHTNPVIEAGKERARDEVWALIYLDIALNQANDPVARDATDASTTSIPISHIQ